MASSELVARRWTHADALMASVREDMAPANLMNVKFLGSPSTGLCRLEGLGLARETGLTLSVTQVVRRLAPFGKAVQGTSAPSVGRTFSQLHVESEIGAFTVIAPAAERQGTTGSTEARRNYKSIVTDPRPVALKGGTGGVPPRGIPDIEG